MLPSIRDAINKGVQNQIKKVHKTTWRKLQDERIKIKDAWGCPVSVGTLYRFTNENYNSKPSTIRKVLGWLKIDFTENHGIFQLIQNEATQNERI